MLCQNCNERPASIHVTKIINGEKNELHLCEQCSYAQDIYNISFNFPSFITNFFDLGEDSNAADSLNGNINSPYACPNCGMNYNTFKRNGKFGCEVCYDTFKTFIHPMIKKLHGKEQHIGKIVKHGGEGLRLEQELVALNTKLTSAIESEAYEDAALYRDKIKEIKMMLEQQNS